MRSCSWIWICVVLVLSCGEDNSTDPAVSLGQGGGTNTPDVQSLPDATSDDTPDAEEDTAPDDSTDTDQPNEDVDAGPLVAGQCTVAQEITCGDVITSTTVEGQLSLAGYGCGYEGQDYSASPEVSYLFVAPTTTKVTFSLATDGTEAQSHELFVMPQSSDGACDVTDCTYGEDKVTLQVTADATYFVTVDNWMGLQGEFSLTVDCCQPNCTDKACGDDGCGGSCGQCSGGTLCNPQSGQCAESLCGDSVAIDCNSVIEAKSLGGDKSADVLDQSSCNDNNYSGPERVYRFENSSDVQLTAKLTSKKPENTLNVLMVKGNQKGQCNGALCIDSNTKSTTAEVKANTPMFVVVDGVDGADGPYTLEMSCCTPDCKDKACGSNGCGGSCGTCPNGGTCNDDNQCDPPDKPPEGSVTSEDFAVVPCPEGLPVYQALEPNDSMFAAWELLDTVNKPGFCIQSASVCGNKDNDYGSDADFIRLEFKKGGDVDFQLNWLSEADMDFFLYEEGKQKPLISFVVGTGAEESGNATVKAGKKYVLKVACWSGESGGWSLWGKL